MRCFGVNNDVLQFVFVLSCFRFSGSIHRHHPRVANPGSYRHELQSRPRIITNITRVKNDSNELKRAQEIPAVERRPGFGKHPFSVQHCSIRMMNRSSTLVHDHNLISWHAYSRICADEATHAGTIKLKKQESVILQPLTARCEPRLSPCVCDHLICSQAILIGYSIITTQVLSFHARPANYSIQQPVCYFARGGKVS